MNDHIAPIGGGLRGPSSDTPDAFRQARGDSALWSFLTSLFGVFALFRKPTDSPAHRSIRRHLIAGMAMLMAVGFGVGGWAATARLAGAVVTSGFLVVDTSAKKIQHPTGGVVSELNVREGDHVAANQILLRLDHTQALAQLMIVTKSLDELRARQARLEAEQDGADEMFVPSDLVSRAGDSIHQRDERNRSRAKTLQCAPRSEKR